ncbi:MAG TPA: four helix bundle protein [Candidatus Paceibacterota bacterium]|nr:hypothetical protein [uncultured archaeon]
MKIEKFEDMQTWQKSKGLAIEIYQCFKSCRDFSFRDQIQRATISISNNIAEGFERLGNKEFRKFLYISKGSCGEVRSMLYLSLDFKYISQKDFDRLNFSTTEISKMLAGFIKKMVI